MYQEGAPTLRPVFLVPTNICWYLLKSVDIDCEYKHTKMLALNISEMHIPSVRVRKLTTFLDLDPFPSANWLKMLLPLAVEIFSLQLY